MPSKYNPPPGWDVPLEGGKPVPGFQPDPNWPAAPEGWQFFTRDESGDNMKQGDAQAPSALTPAADYDFGPALIDDDRALLQALGVYKYHHPLETALEYEKELDEIRGEISSLIKSGEAIHSDTTFVLDNSVAKGSRLTRDLALLCLRSFNAEAENAMRTMRAGSLSLAKGRLEKSRQVIEKLGALMGLKVSEVYFSLRLSELELVSDFLVKKQEDRDAQREERARLREEKRAEEELERERERLDKELEKFKLALGKALANNADADELRQKIEAIETAIEQNDFRLQNMRAGYVYVISNPGAFGENVVKIGMTRRLDPMDRIRELSDASVPFPFEVHLLHFDQDAVSLESKLHQTFAVRKVNLVNLRKEYFFASAQEVKLAIVERIGATVEFNSEVVSEQYLQSKNSWPDGIGR